MKAKVLHFSIKMLWVLISIASLNLYVVSAQFNLRDEAILISTHNVCFYGAIWKIIIKYPFYLFLCMVAVYLLHSIYLGA